MKTIVAAVCLVAFVWAEPPPSNSYLPPSPSARASGGYPQGPQGLGGPGFGAGPQIIAARSSDRGVGKHGANGFARNAAQSHGAQGKFGLGAGLNGGLGGLGGHHDGHGLNGAEGYDRNASPFGRSGFDDASGEPANYNFGYMVNDYEEGTDFGHHEERQDERAEGEYHVVLPDGRKQTVSYEADERGFKPHISYEDTDLVSSRSGGYDSNANSIARGGHLGGHLANARNGGY